MDKFTQFIQEKVAPAAGKISRQKYLHALTQTFMTLMPVMTVGSFALIIADPPVSQFADAGGFMGAFANGWMAFAAATYPIFATLYNVGLNLMAVYVSLGMGYYLAKHYKMNSLLPVFVTFASFMTVAFTANDWSLPTTYLGSSGIFAAIITCIGSFELYRVLSEKKIGYIDMGSLGVPPAIADSLGYLFPTIITLVVVACISGGLYMATGVLVPEVIGLVIAPVTGIINSAWGAAALATLVQFFWWFGIHDSVITGPLTVFFSTGFAENLAAYQAGTATTELPYIVCDPFWWMFVIGFLNVTLAILCLTSKSKQIKTIGRVAIVPSLFNISEPMLFGIPIIFNAELLIPFMLIMPVNTLMTYFSMSTGFISRCFINPSWNTPVFIGQFLTNLDPKTFVLTAAMFVVDMLIWLPFFKAYEAKKVAEERGEIAIEGEEE